MVIAIGTPRGAGKARGGGKLEVLNALEALVLQPIVAENGHVGLAHDEGHIGTVHGGGAHSVPRRDARADLALQIPDLRVDRCVCVCGWMCVCERVFVCACVCACVCLIAL